MSERLIYADLDGTLIKTDLLVETFLLKLGSSPLSLGHALRSAPKGRAAFKYAMAEGVHLDPAALPYREDVLEWLRSQAAEGAKITLATAATEGPARAVATHLGLFSDVLCSSRDTNLKGATKAKAIVQHAQGRSFCYIGDSRSDLEIWKESDRAVVVGGSEELLRRVADVTSIEKAFPATGATARLWIKQARVYQWTKNLLIFVALLVAHKWHDVGAISAALLGFVAFGLCASGVYILNDLLDLRSDRLHPRKRLRPFAAGRIGALQGILVAPLLIAAALVLASLVSSAFFWVTGTYLALTTAYSTVFKKIILVDVLVLAALYTLRVIAGAIAIDVPVSFWLLAFSMNLFLSLALVKRFSELITLADLGAEVARGRDYRVADQGVIQAMGVAAGMGSVLVLALFIHSEEVALSYSRPEALWILCCTVLYWILRLWLKAARGEMHDDPLLYAVRDRASHIMFVLSVGAVVAAL